MAIIEINKELIEEKNDLLRKQNKSKEDEKRIGELNSLIYKNATDFMKKINVEVNSELNVAKPKKEELTTTTLRKILNQKYELYSKYGLMWTRELYPNLIKIKREGKRINKLIKNKELSLEEIEKLVLRY